MPTQILTKETQKRAKCQLASISLFDFCKIVDSEDFYNEQKAPYLKEICDAIEEFENDDNEALIINMPPRHRQNKNCKQFSKLVVG